jgi:hypothetical protein
MSLSDQIDAVNAAQERERSRQEAERQAADAEAARAVAQERTARLAMERRRAEVQKAAQEAQRAAQDEARADKRRDQTYEDELRALEIQRQSVELETMKARAARENEYIDRELKRQDAQTDVIQSDADSNRALSKGAKTMLQDTGAAMIQTQTGAAHEQAVKVSR